MVFSIKITIKHRHTFLDAYSAFASMENHGCQTCVVLYLFFKTQFYLNYFYFCEYQY